jgi:hypothetical protein
MFGVSCSQAGGQHTRNTLEHAHTTQMQCWSCTRRSQRKLWGVAAASKATHTEVTVPLAFSHHFSPLLPRIAAVATRLRGGGGNAATAAVVAGSAVARRRRARDRLLACMLACLQRHPAHLRAGAAAAAAAAALELTESRGPAGEGLCQGAAAAFITLWRQLRRPAANTGHVVLLRCCSSAGLWWRCMAAAGEDGALRRRRATLQHTGHALTD